MSYMIRSLSGTNGEEPPGACGVVVTGQLFIISVFYSLEELKNE